MHNNPVGEKCSVNPYLVDLYQRRKFDELVKNDLTKVIDSRGNTLIHHIADNLDKDAFEQLRNMDQGIFTYKLINTPNNNAELPVHRALKSLKKKKEDDHSFITYMIDVLGANQHVPDKWNRVIAIDSESNKNRKLDFITRLTDYYVNRSQHGGKYKGNRVIKNYYSDTSELSNKRINGIGVRLDRIRGK